MKKKISSRDFEIPWWGGWYNADMPKRLELAKKLLITREFTKMFVNLGIKKKCAERAAGSTVNGYFGDFESYMAERERFKCKTLKCNK